MESQGKVSKATGARLFFTTLVTTLLAIVFPLLLIQSYESSIALGVVLTVLFGGVLVLGVRRVLELSRSPGASLQERSSHARLTLCLTGAFLLAIFGVSVAQYHQHALVQRFTTTFENGGTTQSETVTYTASNWGYVGLGILAVAVLLVFGALAFIPSTEQELRRRIDLEATSVALGTSILFFFIYDGVRAAAHLPRFSGAVAIVSLIVTYLLARLVLSVRYR